MKPPPTYEPLIIWRPRTWLLKAGWLRGGELISMREVPGRRSTWRPRARALQRELEWLPLAASSSRRDDP